MTSFTIICTQSWHPKDEETVPGIEHPGSTGVIYCSDRAIANGFSYADSHEWANLGQGAPEVGPIPNAPDRPQAIPMPTDSLEYAPTTGVKGHIIRSYLSLLYTDMCHRCSSPRVCGAFV
jgi:hypothetical protein